MANSADCAEVATWDKTVKWTREGHKNRKTFECNAVRNFSKNYNLKKITTEFNHTFSTKTYSLMKNSIYCRSVVLNCIKAILLVQFEVLGMLKACSSFLKSNSCTCCKYYCKYKSLSV